jgi:Na+/H+-dicarboxylate symporter
MKLPKIGLLVRILIAIVLGIGCGFFFPQWLSRVFVTFNDLFSGLLGFIVPLLIVGLIAPGIAELGRGAARLLLITAALAYGFTLFSGFFTWGVCEATFPWLLGGSELASVETEATALAPYFSIPIPPLFDVMSALVLAFVLGLGMAFIKGDGLRKVMVDFRDIIMLVITRAIIPLLPLYIFGIFLGITQAGQVGSIMGVFIKLIALIFAITAMVLIIQFCIAGAVARKNPFRMLGNMMTAYVTALGTQSSAATIPVTLEQTLKNGVRPQIAEFVIPLCATIHLSGSTMKITACALAIMLLSGISVDPLVFMGFIFMLGITMIAAPGVPGGAIMAALGILQSMLGFDGTAVGLMIALYIAMDSFGTATNVTGDGAIAVIIDKIAK